MVKKLDPELIQKFKALDNIVVAGGKNILAGQVVDRDENPIQFRAIVRGKGRWSEPGTIHEDPLAELIVEERRTSSSLPCEVWVSPDGSDDNDGTRDNPFASIQYAIDTVVDRVGHERQKRVLINSGIYTEWIVLSTKNIHLKGITSRRSLDISTAQSGIVLIEPPQDTVTRPVLSISNGTKLSQEDLYSSGGLSFDVVNHEVVYSGASLMNRDVSFSPDNDLATKYTLGVTIENIATKWEANNLSGIAAFAMSEDGNEKEISEVSIINCRLKSKWGGFFRSVRNLKIDSTLLSVQPGSYNFGLICQNCCQVTLSHNNVGGGRSFIEGCIFSGGGLTRSELFTNGTDQIIIHFLSGVFSGDLQVNPRTGRRPYIRSSNFNGNLVFAQTGGESANFAGSLREPYPVLYCAELQTRNTADVPVDLLQCATVDHQSTGKLAAHRLFVSGNVTIGAGTFVSEGGTIEGDLIVNTPATANLTNVTVKGSISGTGTVIQNGGGYLGTNTVTTYTHNALKTT